MTRSYSRAFNHVIKRASKRLVLSSCRTLLVMSVLLLVTLHSFAAIASSAVAAGSLDSITIIDDEITARGWAAPISSNQKIAALVIKLNNVIAYSGKYGTFERPDVVQVMHRNDWINSGWKVNAHVSLSLASGKYKVTAQAIMDDGQLVELPIDTHASIIEITAKPSNKHVIKAILFTSILVCCFGVFIAFYYAEECAATLSRRLNHLIHPVITPVIALIVLFISLVSMGTTGSSFTLGVEQSPFVKAESVRVWGTPQPIRSDEWLVVTPLALSQLSHTPAFPVVNKNMGEEGQNMLIIGMTGVPVSHISLLSKPATWGFYLFDMKRALSWYWWFPIFGCLLALWAVFSLIVPNHWRIGFAVSLLFCSSAYVTAWSYWPAYVVFFPCLMLYSSIAILCHKHLISLLGWGILLGLSLAGFVLVLYPPWQVSLGYLFLLMGIGIVLRDKLYLRINVGRLFAFALAISLAAIILWCWWLDAKSAVTAMMNTVYPGRRDSELGGNVTAADFLRGFTNLVTLYRLEGYSNKSEIASFYYSLPALLVLFGLCVLKRQIGFIQSLLLAFIVYAMLFMLVGIPKDVATFTLWGRVPALRADLSLGLAVMLLSGMLLASNTATHSVYKIATKLLVMVVSLLWGGFVVYSLSQLPHESLSGFASGITVAIIFVIVLQSWWLAIGAYRQFLLLSLAFSISTTLPFNPMMIAPSHIDSAINPAKKHARILVANTQVPAMLLAASGQPVSNGIFYYPQKTLWNRLDANGSQENVYNRYQHLMFTLGAVQTPYYHIESPSPDVVKVVVDSTYFDFNKTGADILLASNDVSALKLNPSIHFVSERDGWSTFTIVGQGVK